MVERGQFRMVITVVIRARLGLLVRWLKRPV